MAAWTRGGQQTQNRQLRALDINGAALTTRPKVRPRAGLVLDQVIERRSVRSEPARSAAATTAAAARLLLRFVDLQRASVEVLAIQRLHGAGGVGVRHLNKPESARTTGLAIVDQGHFLHRTVRSEQRANAVLGCREGEITNIQFRHRNSLTEKRDWAGMTCRLVRAELCEGERLWPLEGAWEARGQGQTSRKSTSRCAHYSNRRRTAWNSSKLWEVS